MQLLFSDFLSTITSKVRLVGRPFALLFYAFTQLPSKIIISGYNSMFFFPLIHKPCIHRLTRSYPFPLPDKINLLMHHSRYIYSSARASFLIPHARHTNPTPSSRYLFVVNWVLATFLHLHSTRIYPVSVV